MMKPDEEAVFATLTGAEDTLSPQESRNGLRHVAALSMTKLSDGLLNPKLVLAWLAQALGAPAVLIGLLVPIREAGALLPQLLLARRIEAMRRRKWAWVAGSLGQGAAAAGMVVVALTLDGLAAGVALCLLLALLALARSAASVSYKDVLGKTVAKTRRGTVTGTAGSLSATGVILFALLLMSGLLQDVAPVTVAVAIAAGLWICAGLLFATLEEPESTPDPATALIDLSPLREDAQFRRFVLARGALTATALAPPHIVMLDDSGGALQALGALVLASAAASFASSYVWGRMADRSSRRVLVLSGLCGGIAMALAAAAGMFGLAATPWVAPVILFILMVAYHGVREGRSTYLVDMAPETARARYAALANTLIGGLLLLTGALGGALAAFGPVAALAGFAALSLVGALLALRLDEVERG
ncbi:MFS transporter [Salipiger sp.]|uniref:MFS transporter n=1 Tax=Salipiger sp. TaxID=2078585 RepID=UPI003A96C70E